MNAIILSRLRILLVAVSVLLLVISSKFSMLFWLAVASLVYSFLVYFRLGIVKREPIKLTAPVNGTWLAVNGPATKVPSHGTNAYGQTYAIDLVFVSERRPKPVVAWKPISQPANSFDGFGKPIFAPTDGRIVRVHDKERDHRSRSSWPALVYFMIEAAFRELMGPRKILGNHVVIDAGNGNYVALAHLRKGSAQVKLGEQVKTGQQIGECGNSGNSTEPHVHLQVVDHPFILIAAGLPFEFDYEINGGTHTGVPKDTVPFQSPKRSNRID